MTLTSGLGFKKSSKSLISGGPGFIKFSRFSGRLEFEIIREVFWNEPLVETIQLSDRIMVPKPLKSKPEDLAELKPFAAAKNSIRKQSMQKGSRRQSAKKSISRKSVSRKSVSRKSVSRKSVSRKSVSRQSVSRKSVSRKSVSRKSVSRKSVSRKSIARKQSIGGKKKDGKRGSDKSGKPSDTPAPSHSVEALMRAAMEKKKREEQTCLQFLSDAVDANFVKTLFPEIDVQNMPDKWKALIPQGLPKGPSAKGQSRRQSRRQSRKQSRKQSTRKSVRRQSKKK